MANAEVQVDDAELEALMAELDTQTAGAVAAPAAPKPAPKAIETTPPEVVQQQVAERGVVGMTDAGPVVAAVPDVPKGKDPVEAEESHFIVPDKMKAVADPPAWGDTVIDPADDPEAGAAPVVEAPKVAKPESSVVGKAAPADPENTPAKKPAPQLQHAIDPSQFKVETAVSDVNLDQCMIEQSSLRATYGELLARAEAQAARVKLQVEVKEAELYDKHRKALAAGGEKVTEKAVENAVKTDPLWLKLQARKIEADTIADINKHMVRSLDDRRDMLIQLGADRREEGKGQLRILQDKALAERATSAAKGH